MECSAVKNGGFAKELNNEMGSFKDIICTSEGERLWFAKKFDIDLQLNFRRPQRFRDTLAWLFA